MGIQEADRDLQALVESSRRTMERFPESRVARSIHESHQSLLVFLRKKLIRGFPIPTQEEEA